MAAAAPHFSGDLFLAFPANPGTLRSGRQPLSLMSFLLRGIPGPFYEAVVQAAEEAVVNALAANQDMTCRDGHRSPALPRDCVNELPARVGRVA